MFVLSQTVSADLTGRYVGDDQQDQQPSKASVSSSASKCSIYLAPSTIPNAGLGIFTTILKQKGDFIGQGDVILPLFEMDWHNELIMKYPSDPSFTYFNPFSEYAWTGDSMGMGFEVQSDDVGAMCPGLGAAINFNLALVNVGKAILVRDDGGLHRSRDPGAGALTLYHDGTTPIVHRNIPAGGELFKFYGDSWFETRSNVFGGLPLSEDYARAQRLLDEFGRLIGMAKHSTPNAYQFRLMVDMQRDLWRVVSNFPIPSRTLNALPKRLEDAWIAIQDELVVLYQPYAVRSKSYLEEHGKCFDHIKPGRSSITQAGRGAFASRPLKQGTIISGTPLLHLPDYNAFHMYDFYKNETTRDWQRGDTVIGRQLKLNYCFGHSKSTILLCPYGAGVAYINHNQTLANVRFRWSKLGLTSHNDSWFNLTPAQMEWTYRPNLAVGSVASRDIEESEELFMDYGNEFEEAWQFHLINWRPVPDAKAYVSAHDFNFRMSETPLRTEREQELDPYPNNLQLRCHSILADQNWRQRMPRHPHNGSWWPLNEKGHSCRILSRIYEENIDLYAVQILQQFGTGEATQHNRSRVPRHAVGFADGPYTTDMHLRNALRFPIMIPDKIFPNAWRNSAHHNYTN